MRIGYTLLPEIQGGEDEHKTLIDKFVEILNGSESSEQSAVAPIMTLEFLLIVCLPLLGFSGDPLSYEPNYDIERPYHR